MSVTKHLITAELDTLEIVFKLAELHRVENEAFLVALRQYRSCLEEDLVKDNDARVP